TGLLDIVGLDVDPIRNVIVAASRKGNGEKVGLFVFDRLANGDVEPKQFIGGPNSKLAHFRQVTIDPATGNIFLAQQNTRMKQMEAYVLEKPREEFKAKEREKSDDEDDSDEGRLDTMGFIAVYARDHQGARHPPGRRRRRCAEPEEEGDHHGRRERVPDVPAARLLQTAQEAIETVEC